MIQQYPQKYRSMEVVWGIMSSWAVSPGPVRTPSNYFTISSFHSSFLLIIIILIIMVRFSTNNMQMICSSILRLAQLKTGRALDETYLKAHMENHFLILYMTAMLISRVENNNKLASSVDAITISEIWKHYWLTHWLRRVGARRCYRI